MKTNFKPNQTNVLELTDFTTLHEFFAENPFDAADTRSFTAFGLQFEQFDFRSDLSLPSGAAPAEEVPGIGQHDPKARELAELRNRIASEAAAVPENFAFRYYMVHRPGDNEAERALLMLHGLNERAWSKYLVWATALAQRTGRPVLLFPTAFHMNRAPEAWSDRRQMQPLVRERVSNFPELNESSFLNVALSTRLSEVPGRFFWSGYQTYLDLVVLLRSAQQGHHPGLATGVQFDIFGYSAGAFLSQVLLMANPENRLAESRALLFCGGSTLDRTEPVSRYIIDSKAAESLQHFMEDELWNNLSDPQVSSLMHLLEQESTAGGYFLALLRQDKLQALREKRFSELGPQLKAIALAKDQVTPPARIRETLQAPGVQPPVEVCVFDFDYPYNHVTPFNPRPRFAAQANAAFERVFAQLQDDLA